MWAAHYDSRGFLSHRLYRAVWTAARTGASLLPLRARAIALSLGGPLMIPATLLLWVGLEVIGFGLLYYEAMEDATSFVHGRGLEPSFREAASSSS